MSMRRQRGEPQLEPIPRDTQDSFYSLGRIFGARQASVRVRIRVARNDRKFMQKMKMETKIESSKKPPAWSCNLSSDHLKQRIRHSYVNRNRFPGLPVRDWTPLHSYLPGAAVGYRRLWMQDNPWPDKLKKEMGSGQDHMHRMKHREQKKQSNEPSQKFVPGGNSNDPLNLTGSVKEEAPVESSGHVNMPVNNFIPINQQDPLGLTQDEDDETPVALKYSLRKRKQRSRGKKKDQGIESGSQTHVSRADNVSTSSADSVSDQTKSIESGNQSMLSEKSFVEQTANLKNEAGDQMMVDTEKTYNHGKESVSEKSAADVSVNNDSMASHDENNSSQPAVSVEAGSGVDGGGSTQSDVSVGNAVEPMEESAGSHTRGGSVDDRATQDFSDMQKQVAAAPFRGRSTSLPQCRQDAVKKMRLQKQKLKELQKQANTMKQLYPVRLSPLDDSDRGILPHGRNALRKALRIDPVGIKEQEEMNRKREKEERDFKRRRRYPNLKSPEEDVDERHSADPRTLEALKVDVNLSQERTSSPAFQEPQSRTVDSLISPPVLRSEPSQIRKRRRTVSDGSTESAPTGATKKVVIRRSSSPDVRSSHHSPRKIRRLSGSGQVEPEPSPKRERQIKFSKNPAYKHGNYYRYYGYRTPAMAPDFRLYYFRREWFEGKDVLDVGCNAGDVTLAVAQLFHPRKIVGMDIDPNLIRIARQNIRSHQTKANMYQEEKFPVSTTEYGPIEPLPALTNPSNIFPKNVMFMQGNYVLKSDEELDHVKEEYDTILALSITKWIHLNHGDDGLKRVFHRIYQQLRPGGHLILEPQTWASYRRRKKLTAKIYENYNKIQLKPNDFATYLTETVGFCRREYLGQPLNASKGFQRPLWLFTKYKSSPDYTPSPENQGTYEVVEQRSIRERMAHLAGYTSYHSTPDFPPHPAAAPYTSSPLVPYNPYLPGPSASFTPSSGFQHPYPAPYDPYDPYYPYPGQYYDERMEEEHHHHQQHQHHQNHHHHNNQHQHQHQQSGDQSGGQRVSGESVSSSSFTSGSSSGVTESYTSTNSSQQQDPHYQPQSSPSPPHGLVEWVEQTGQYNGNIMELSEEHYAPQENGFCNGHVEDPAHGSPEELPAEGYHGGLVGYDMLGDVDQLGVSPGGFEEPEAAQPPQLEYMYSPEPPVQPVYSPEPPVVLPEAEEGVSTTPPPEASSPPATEWDPPSQSLVSADYSTDAVVRDVVRVLRSDSKRPSATVGPDPVQHSEISSSVQGRRTSTHTSSRTSSRTASHTSSHNSSHTSSHTASHTSSTSQEPVTPSSRVHSLSQEVADPSCHTSPDSSIAETHASETSTDELPQTSTGQTSTGQLPQTSTGQTSRGQSSQTSRGQLSQTSTGQTSRGQLSQTSTDRLPQTSTEQLPQTSTEQLPQTSTDQFPQTSAVQLPQTSTDQLPQTSPHWAGPSSSSQTPMEDAPLEPADASSAEAAAPSSQSEAASGGSDPSCEADSSLVPDAGAQ